MANHVRSSRENPSVNNKRKHCYYLIQWCGNISMETRGEPPSRMTGRVDLWLPFSLKNLCSISLAFAKGLLHLTRIHHISFHRYIYRACLSYCECQIRMFRVFIKSFVSHAYTRDFILSHTIYGNDLQILSGKIVSFPGKEAYLYLFAFQNKGNIRAYSSWSLGRPQTK